MEQVMNFVSLAWPFLVLVGIMYFFMYRPQQKLKVERGRFLMSLRKGDHVVTAGGIHGTIKVLIRRAGDRTEGHHQSGKDRYSAR